MSAQGLNQSMAFIAEATYGTTPATPVMKPLRSTGTTLALTKDTIQSEEIRPDRQIADFKHGNKQVGGGVDFELAFTDFDDFLEAVMCGTWDADNPQAGTDRLLVGLVRRSFTIERHFADISKYIRYTGAELNEMSLSISPNANVTGSFSVIGKSQDGTNAIVSGATYPDSVGGGPFDSFSGVITEGGSSIATVTQIDFTVANGIEPQFVIGNDSPEFTTFGKSIVTGTVTAYFADVTLLNKFVAETDSSLLFTLTNAAGDVISFNFPKIVYTGGQPDVSGDGPISIALDFQAIVDSTAGSQLVVDRTPV
jgi:hypothetical protein